MFDAGKVAGHLPSEASTEEIFTFYFNNVWPDDNQAQWYCGSRACSSDPNCMYGGYDLILPTSYCVNIFEPGDKRKDASIRTDFVYNGKQPSPVAGFGEDQLKPHTTVRTRAFGGALPAEYTWDTGMSQDEFRTKILDERMRELACEGWRRIDLARTGKFEELIRARNTWQVANPTVEAKHRLFPLPMVEIKQNPNLSGDQNPGLN